jgi:hypothetical protein
LPGATFAEDNDAATLSEDLDRNDPVLEPVADPGPAAEGADVAPATGDADAYAAGVESEISSLDDNLQALRRQKGSLTKAQEAALRDFESAKDDAESALDEFEDADAGRAESARSRLDVEMAALRNAHQRATSALQ